MCVCVVYVYIYICVCIYTVFIYIYIYIYIYLYFKLCGHILPFVVQHGSPNRPTSVQLSFEANGIMGLAPGRRGAPTVLEEMFQDAEGQPGLVEQFLMHIYIYI